MPTGAPECWGTLVTDGAVALRSSVPRGGMCNSRDDDAQSLRVSLPRPAARRYSVVGVQKSRGYSRCSVAALPTATRESNAVAIA